MAKYKLTYELVDKAVELKSHGLNDCDIARAIGVCKQTFSKWINHPETKVQRTLAEQLKKTETEYKAALLDTIMQAAISKQSNWTAAAWLLERKYPEEFSQNRRLDTDKKEDIPQIMLGVTVGKAGDLEAPVAGAIAGATLNGKALVAGASSENTDPVVIEVAHD